MTPRRWVVAAVVIGLAVLCWADGAVGVTSGVEYSPEAVAHRSFRQVVLFGWIPLSPRRTEEWRTPLDEYLIQRMYATPQAYGKSEWVFVKGFAPGVRGWSGPAKHACWGMGCWDGSSQEWVDWSNEHPENAEALWPTVVSWLRERKFERVLILLQIERDSVIGAESSAAIEEAIARAQDLAEE